MKKILLTIVGCTLSFIAYSQVPLSSYTPIYGGNTPNVNTQQRPENFENAAGYYYDNYARRFKRIKIKVNATQSFAGVVVYLKYSYNSNYERWIPEGDAIASKVNAYIDGEELASNFEWKVNSSYGVIYFNY